MTKAEKEAKRLQKKVDRANVKYLEACANAEKSRNELAACEKEYEKQRVKVEDKLYLPASESTPQRKWALVKRLSNLNTVNNTLLHFFNFNLMFLSILCRL